LHILYRISIKKDQRNSHFQNAKKCEKCPKTEGKVRICVRVVGSL